jgi:aspartate aminotransferase
MVLLNGGEPLVDCPIETGFKLTPKALDAAITNAPSGWSSTPRRTRRRAYSAANSGHRRVLLRHPHCGV